VKLACGKHDGVRNPCHCKGRGSALGPAVSFALCLDRIVGRVMDVGRWLALPVALILFAQWPLRDLVKGWSREANDLGQWLFALYVAMSVTAATRARTHLAADMLARGYRSRARRWLARIGIALGILPWCGLILVTSWPLVTRSVLGLERFADTSNPFYFIIKLALWLLGGLMILQGLADLTKPDEETRA
jgi:TRAP-type mannitol/chloroaromatic compound transport system permease small subunit